MVEQVGRIVEGDVGSAVPVLDKRELQVEFGGVQRDFNEPGGRAEQAVHIRRATLVGDHRLEQRVAADRPGRFHRVDYRVERRVGAGERFQVDGTDPVQQVGESRVAGQVHAQHQRVEEEADSVVDGFVGAVGDRAAQRDVVAGAQTVQEHGDSGLDHHEDGDAVLGGEAAHSFDQFRGEFGTR